MFGITLLSETVNDRSFVSMLEDVWSLPFLVALYTLPPNPNQWIYFVRASIELRSRLPLISFIESSDWSIVLPVSKTRVDRFSEISH